MWCYRLFMRRALIKQIQNGISRIYAATPLAYRNLDGRASWSRMAFTVRRSNLFTVLRANNLTSFLAFKFLNRKVSKFSFC